MPTHTDMHTLKPPESSPTISYQGLIDSKNKNLNSMPSAICLPVYYFHTQNLCLTHKLTSSLLDLYGQVMVTCTWTFPLLSLNPKKLLCIQLELLWHAFFYWTPLQWYYNDTFIKIAAIRSQLTCMHFSKLFCARLKDSIENMCERKKQNNWDQEIHKTDQG